MRSRVSPRELVGKRARADVEAALEGLRESGERVSLAAAVKKAGAFELFAETLARFAASSIAHRNATLARGQLRDALDRPEPPLNTQEKWPMFGTHCVMS